MLMNIEMATIVGILSFIGMINTAYESLKVRKVSTFRHFSVSEQLKSHAQLS